MKTYFVVVAGMLGSLLAGCSSEIRVAEVPPATQAGDTLAGVPFRVLRKFNAVIYEKKSSGYERIGDDAIVIPDPNHLYVVNFNAQLFANPTFSLALNPDGTLKEVGLKSKSSGADALKELGTQVDAVAAARRERDKNVAGAIGESSDLQIALAQAKSDALVAEAEFTLLSGKSDASRIDLLKAEQKKRDAELKANKAALLAGQPRPYPNTLP